MSTTNNSAMNNVADDFAETLTVPERLDALQRAVPLDEFKDIWGDILNDPITDIDPEAFVATGLYATDQVFKFMPTDPAADFDPEAFVSNMAAISLREKIGKELRATRKEFAYVTQYAVVPPTTRRRLPTARMAEYATTADQRRERRRTFLMRCMFSLEGQLEAVDAILCQ
eukprot:3356608-Rhodomonas_salina.1